MRLLPYLAQAGALAAVYFVAAKLSLALAIPPGYATAVWPPSGIALAALLLFGDRVWPGVWLGATLANLTVEFSAFAAPVIGCGNTLEALAAAALTRRAIGAGREFARGEDVIRFAAVAAVSCVVGATLANTGLALLGSIAWSSFPVHWWTWWQGDLAGMVIVTPLILSWSAPRDIQWTLSKKTELLVFALIVVTTSLVVFAGWFANDKPLPLPFLTLPLIIWAAFRFTQREVTTAIAVVCAIAVWQTAAGRGPFALASVNESLLVLQAFISTVVVTGLVLAAVIGERSRATARLRRARDDLQLRVQERTTEHERANRALQADIVKREEMEHGLQKARDELEKRVAERTAELSRINAELEKFAYVAAHDLQEPLRTVINFSDLLEQRYRERLDADGREFLGFIVSSVARMQQLVNDVLHYSRTGRETLALERADCNAVVDRALANLQQGIEESGAIITRGALPVIVADADQMVTLFQNLIGNAIKFRSADPPRIHVAVRPEPGGWVFSVRDNGIGIHPRYHQRIFEMFQRLHGFSKYPGSGMGLPICRKIAERHEGRIWVESEEGTGATFCFSIPRLEGVHDGDCQSGSRGATRDPAGGGQSG